MRTGIILCSRLDSERLPKKVFKKINGVTVFAHLVSRLCATAAPVVVAVPREQFLDYVREVEASGLSQHSNLTIYPSDHSGDPLARMKEVAKVFGFTRVVRVTHDKIFVDVEQMREAMQVFHKAQAEYLYLPDMLPGTGFEILSTKCLNEAAQKFKDVEHVSYAARLVSRNTIRLPSTRSAPAVPLNLLIDFAEDLDLLEVIFSQLGNQAKLSDVVKFINASPELAEINRAPILSIYTCAYNASQFIEAAMASVESQSIFRKAEFILIDDHSSDDTCAKMARFAIGKPNVQWVRNERNIGLASSSNKALKRARGKYLVRLDADDFFVGTKTLSEMIDFAEKTGAEALYPDNHFGAFNLVQKGSECHHVGGALFCKRAINFVKFTDGLRHFEGLELFARAKDRLKIGYYGKPTFFYRQHGASMSQSDDPARQEIRRQIEVEHGV